METKTKSSRASKHSNLLVPQEALLIWRKRKNWNQQQAAEYYGVSPHNYKLAEYGKYDKFRYNKKFKFSELAPHERCLIYRRRSGKTQAEIAEKIGIGRYWLRLQEMGKVPCTKLLMFWEN